MQNKEQQCTSLTFVLVYNSFLLYNLDFLQPVLTTSAARNLHVQRHLGFCHTPSWFCLTPLSLQYILKRIRLLFSPRSRSCGPWTRRRTSPRRSCRWPGRSSCRVPVRIQNQHTQLYFTVVLPHFFWLFVKVKFLDGKRLSSNKTSVNKLKISQVKEYLTDPAKTQWIFLLTLLRDALTVTVSLQNNKVMYTLTQYSHRGITSLTMVFIVLVQWVLTVRAAMSPLRSGVGHDSDMCASFAATSSFFSCSIHPAAICSIKLWGKRGQEGTR